MPYLLAIILVLALIYGPHLWVRYILRRHGNDRPDFPGTGGELAEHILAELNIGNVTVERTDTGDHYSTGDKAVRLRDEHLDGRSVTAVAVAVHEVGHAIQDAEAYATLEQRTTWVASTQVAERIGSAIVLLAPIAGLISQSPAMTFGIVGIGIATMAIRVLVHLVTLPVEFDASFKRALPILENGGYLADKDLAAARQILWACALTYVASTLVSLFNVWRWLRFWR